MSCRDYTVSRETFAIVRCNRCGFKFTNPRPDELQILNYYESDDYISHSNTKKGLVNWLYQKVRSITLNQKLRLIRSVSGDRRPETVNLLDIGCGTGEFLNRCARAGYKTMGVEPSLRAKKFAIENYRLDVAGEEMLKQLEPERFDVITMWHVLEHVHRLHDRVEELKKLLKRDGVLVIAVPNCSSWDAHHYKEFWAAYDVPRHLYHFTPPDIQSLFFLHAMKVEKILPMKFDSYYVSMLSEKYETGSPKMLRSTWNGFLSNLKAKKTGQEYSSQIYIIRK